MGGMTLYQPVAATKSQSCANCFNSMFRSMRGVTVMYCGYYYRPVAVDGCCINWNQSIKK